MSNRPLNDEEVQTELSKMKAFIKQEAMEKAREIQVKADEEHAIEKAKIVRQESINIDATYEKKMKQADVAQKIAQSNLTNKSRLTVLQAREQHLQELFDEARGRLTQLSKDEGKYTQLLEQLILQGLLELMEPNVSATVRSKDVDLAKAASEGAAKQYKDISGRDVSVKVEDGLEEDVSGGVILACHGDRIKVNNTLDERLRLLEEAMLPEIRVELFGPNPNRKFFN